MASCKVKAATDKTVAVTNSEFLEDFRNEIPYTIKHEIKVIKKQTEKDDREKSLTICKLNDKIFIGNYAKGRKDSTTILPCHKKYGKEAVEIGDIHTHPFNDKSTIGITPSEADMVGNLTDSFQSGTPKISCIVGAGKKSIFAKSDTIHCFQPKKEVIEDAHKIKMYNRAYGRSENVGNDVDPFLRQHLPDDLNHIWYVHGKALSKAEEREYSEDLLSEMLGQSGRRLKFNDINVTEKGSFCDLIQGYNLPDNNEIGNKCRDRLEVKEFYGYEY